MVVFLIIAVASIALILSPAVNHARVYGQEHIAAPSALTADGMLLRVETWKTYPEYNIGLGVIAVLAFSGAVFTCTMYDLQSKCYEPKLEGLKEDAEVII